MRILTLLCGLAIGAGILPAQAGHTTSVPPAMWQNMPLIALLNGYLAGNINVQSALAHGDFGLGAFGDLEGEMIALNGKMFQIGADGKPRERDGATQLAYAQIVRFHPTKKFVLPADTSFDKIAQAVNAELPLGNSTYAVRLTGTFAALTTRAPHKQSPPYPTFCEAMKTQQTFPLDGREGTMAGFVGPPYISTIDSAGFHLHFLAQDHGAGGHVLSFRTGKVTIELEKIDRVIVDTPTDPQFDRVPMATIATCH